MLYRYLCFISLSIAITNSHCTQSAEGSGTYKSPAGYNLNEPFLIIYQLNWTKYQAWLSIQRHQRFRHWRRFGWLYKFL